MTVAPWRWYCKVLRSIHKLVQDGEHHTNAPQMLKIQSNSCLIPSDMAPVSIEMPHKRVQEVRGKIHGKTCMAVGIWCDADIIYVWYSFIIFYNYRFFSYTSGGTHIWTKQWSIFGEMLAKHCGEILEQKTSPTLPYVMFGRRVPMSGRWVEDTNNKGFLAFSFPGPQVVGCMNAFARTFACELVLRWLISFFE